MEATAVYIYNGVVRAAISLVDPVSISRSWPSKTQGLDVPEALQRGNTGCATGYSLDLGQILQQRATARQMILDLCNKSSHLGASL